MAMDKDDIEYVCTWLENYTILYIYDNEDEVFKMINTLKEVLNGTERRKKYRERLARKRIGRHDV